MTTKSSYEGYIKEAANSPEQSEREKYYTDAIKIDPRRGEAYHNLLQLCIRGADGSENDFDREETARLTSVLGYKGSGNRTNESYFEGNKEIAYTFVNSLNRYKNNNQEGKDNE